MLQGEPPLKIAVVGSGIAGLGAAWLLSKRHDVSVFEQDIRIGGHANPVTIKHERQDIAVDTGFIVFNETNYPNLTSLFHHLEVETQLSDMSLAISLDNGAREYAGDGLLRVFAQKSHLFDRRFLAMLFGIFRFYRDAPLDCLSLADDVTLGEYLREKKFGRSFCEDHLLPMSSAIWSTPASEILSYPVRSFVAFYQNHGLLQISGRPLWRTVAGSSRSYLAALTKSFSERIFRGRRIASISTDGSRPAIIDTSGEREEFDHVVVATHADDAAKLVENIGTPISTSLRPFRYSANRAVLHSDATLMPRRRRVWSSWNVLGAGRDSPPVITYWMNRLQGLPEYPELFLTLNPPVTPAKTHYETSYRHPLYDVAALAVQRNVRTLQGHGGLWFCGSYLGHGFHEDALDSGLAAAEAIDPLCRRPWRPLAQISSSSIRERALAR
jgi:uncharacterized protein